MTLPRIKDDSDVVGTLRVPLFPGSTSRVVHRHTECAYYGGTITLLWIVLCLSSTWLAAQEPPLVFRGAALETMGQAGRVENGTLVIRGGKIESVGSGQAIAETARVMDATGRTITPGWIDPYRVINIASENSAAPETRTIVVGRRTFTVQGRRGITGGSFTRVADNFYPFGAHERVALRCGMTQLNLVARGLGQAAIARVTPDHPDSMIENPDGNLFLSLTNQSESLDVLRSGLASVARSGRPPGGGSESGRPSFGGGPPGGFGGGRPGGGFSGFPSGGGTPSSAASSAATRELWQKVYEGKSPLIVNANNSATILHLLNLLQPYPDVRVLLVANGSNVYETLDKLRGRKVSLILRPTIDLVPNSRDRVCVSKLVHEAGLEFAFSLSLDEGDMASSQDSPLFPVAYQVRCGLPRRVALEALTTRPATMLGIDKKDGSLEPGKSANLLVFDGDPLDPNSQLRQVLVEGEIVYDN